MRTCQIVCACLFARLFQTNLQNKHPMTSFVVVAIFKNETTNLMEWLDHYKWQGASHIYLLDNGSTDQPEKVLDPFLQDGFVTCLFDKTPFIQIKYYQSIVKHIQELEQPPDWILIADLDEFWFSTTTNLCNEHEQVPEHIRCVYCSWIEFGPSEDGSHPSSLRKELVYRNPTTLSPKYCFRTMQVQPEAVKIHEVLIPEKDCIRNPTGIRLHHYFTQSYEYWHCIKIPRGSSMGDLSVYANTQQRKLFEERGSAVCTVLDTTLSDLVKQYEAARDKN